MNTQHIEPITLNGFTLNPAYFPNNNLAINQIQAVVSNAVGSTAAAEAVSVAISVAGKFYSELQLLQKLNPGEYETVLKDIVTKLDTATQKSSGDEKQFLTALTEKFQLALKGDIGALQQQSVPVNGDLLPTIPARASKLGNILASPNQDSLSQDLLNVQLQQSTLESLVSKNFHPLSAIGDLLNQQISTPATIGDLFVSQSGSAVNIQHMVEVYGTHGQLLSEAFSSGTSTSSHVAFSADTQQALDSIVSELHFSLFGSDSGQKSVTGE